MTGCYFGLNAGAAEQPVTTSVPVPEIVSGLHTGAAKLPVITCVSVLELVLVLMLRFCLRSFHKSFTHSALKGMYFWGCAHEKQHLGCSY